MGQAKTSGGKASGVPSTAVPTGLPIRLVSSSPSKSLLTTLGPVSPKASSNASTFGLPIRSSQSTRDVLGSPTILDVPSILESGERDLSNLRPYQVATVEFLADHPCALLADEMGVGKTPPSLRALGPNASAIVVCPKSLALMWGQRAHEWRAELGVIYRELPARNQLAIWTFEQLPEPTPGQALFPGKNLRDVTLIVDEAQAVKNVKTRRHKAVKALRRQCGRGWFLTGTPLTNKPSDLWGVLDCGNMALKVFDGYEHFLESFHAEPLWITRRTTKRDGTPTYRKERIGYKYHEPTPEVPERLKRVMLRRLKRDVLADLPPKQFTDLYVEAPTSAELLGELAAAQLYLEGFELDNPGELPPFEKFAEVRAKLAHSRIDAMLDFVEQYEESETPLVVFAEHKAPIMRLHGREGWAVITGDTKPQERKAYIDCFQGGLLSGIALTIATGGVGIDLTYASNVLFVDMSFSPALNNQAIDRLHRMGQTADRLTITRMVSDHPVDVRLLKLITDKMRMFEMTMGDV